MIEQVLVIGTFLLLGYTYVLYPRAIGLLARLFGKPWKIDGSETPTVSVILAAYNEESVIERCLDSILKLEYPQAKIEVLVGSDGSTDRTPEILSAYAAAHPLVTPYSFQERRGKVPVVNELVAYSRGEILFFADSDVIVKPSSLRMHVRNYADPKVGGVAATLRLLGHGAPTAGSLKPEQSYLTVENLLRKHEAQLHSTVGIFGGHYSIRRSLWKDVPNEPLLDELCVALTIVQSSHRMVFEEEAIAEEYSDRSMSDEFARRTRFASRGLATLAMFRSLMNPAKGWIALMLWSHRLFRWLSPWMLILLAVATFLGAVHHSAFWMPALLYLELVSFGLFVVIALILGRRASSHPILTHLYWFGAMNLACLVGMYRYLFKRERKFWRHMRTSPASKKRSMFATGIEGS